MSKLLAPAIAEFAAELSYDTIPEKVRDAAMLRRGARGS